MNEELKNKFLKLMLDLQNETDIEANHTKADNLLCELLTELGYDEIVEAYNNLPGWYA